MLIDIFRSGYQIHISGCGSLGRLDEEIRIDMYPKFSPGGEHITRKICLESLECALNKLGEVAKKNPVKLPKQMDLL